MIIQLIPRIGLDSWVNRIRTIIRISGDDVEIMIGTKLRNHIDIRAHRPSGFCTWEKPIDCDEYLFPFHVSISLLSYKNLDDLLKILAHPNFRDSCLLVTFIFSFFRNAIKTR